MTLPDAPLPAPEPIFDADTEPYWRGAGKGRLLLTQCESCEAFVWIPRPYCPVDLSPTRWVEASGRGVVYSHTTVHKGERSYAKRPPFVLAYVELDEGPRIMTNIVGCDPEAVVVGMPVTAVFDPVEGGEGIAIPRFTPV
jgi:uncharacterized OB-fold protein